MKGLLLSIFMIFFSCNSQKKASMNNDDVDTSDKLTLLLQDNYSGSDVAETMIITDAKTLKSFYSRINKTRKPGIPVPDVDFTKEMILVNCIGLQKSDAVSKLSIMEETDEELVLKTFDGSKEEKSVSRAEISPFSVYKIPLTSKKIIFKKEL